MIAIYCLQDEPLPIQIREILFEMGIPAVRIGPECGNVSIAGKVPFVFFTKAALPFGKSVSSRLPSENVRILTGDEEPMEIVSSLRAEYFRRFGQNIDEARGGGFSFAGRQVSFRGHPVRLTNSEYRILRLLFHSRCVFFTAEEIGAACLSAPLGSPRVHICNMNGKSRRVLGRPMIETRRYEGYRVK